ncbi:MULTISPECIES: FkbM family methyltransferase [Arcobacteraceae]|uniref:Methyltransferase n=1 Tax=Poseidonibacter parvus TaxID=1850254 RepID=A0A1P8KLQ6_9BACT|nr:MULTISPECIES: FkbM family methyltransferase [Arcobacteraceae]APW65503.1 methyltransferase [Poseidonibacter parvus]
MNLVGLDYINEKDKKLVELFISDSKIKKYILGINKLGKCVAKQIEVDGIIDDFSRVHTSRKKSILQIEEVPKDSIILVTASGSPLEVKNKLDELGYTHFNYLALIKYSKLDLVHPPFIMDFKEDFLKNESKYKQTYDLLEDEKSKEVFTKVINFKISFDLDFMEGFTNNHEEQYFDKDIIPKIENINFVDGGAYIGDTLPQIIKEFPDYNKIYCIEPNNLHIGIAKKNFPNQRDIKFINCGLGKEEIKAIQEQEVKDNCYHDYQAEDINTLDNLIKEKVDFIKLDIEGAEQDAIMGSKQTILKYHPILAICIYHKAQDWYKVPQIVLEIRNDYKVFIRHYMEGIYESVMYFIPNK